MSINENLVSVIVTAYNVEEYLDRCIETLVTQTYPYIEIILVDDGSTDRTGVICDNWANKDDRVVVIHKKNGGPSDARNAGIKSARGKWLGFVDGDDYVSSTMFEHLYQHRIEQGITVCGLQTEKNGIRYSWPAINKKLQQREAVDLYIANELKTRCYGGFTYWGSYSCNKLFDRSLFAYASFPVGKKYEDVYIIMDWIKQSASIQFIPDCDYIYVQRLGSITHEDKVVKELLNARLHQKEQIFRYWHITDPRVDKLVACEYYYILYRYSILPLEKRKQHRETAAKAWVKLKEYGYDFLPMEKRVKLLLFVHCPEVFRLLKKIKSLFN